MRTPVTSYRTLLRPERLRNIERPFGWVPCRLLTQGLLARMSQHARQLYLLLVLAADRRGLSFYGIKRSQQILGLSEAELRQARMELIQMDLLASDGKTHQVLSLRAAQPVQTTPMVPMGDANSAPAVHFATDMPSAADDQHKPIPENIREALRGIFGRDEF